MSENGPTTYRLLLGRDLRRMREAAGVSREQSAQQLGADASKISRIEQGAATLRPSDIDRLLSFYDADEEDAENARDLGRQARKRGSYGKVPDWARQYIGLEADAARLDAFDSELVPGLFQVRDYARAVVATSPVVAAVDIDRVVDARIKRQAVLTRKNPPRLRLVLGEAALMRMVGGPSVMAEQLEHLVKLAGREHISIQVLPFDVGEHAALGTSFMLVDLEIGEATSSWVYLEDLTRADCLDGSSHVGAYKLTFSHLIARALSERESIEMLENAIDDLAR